MKPTEPDPVKLFIGVLYSDEGVWGKAKESLERSFGEIDFESPRFLFKVTDYYCEEMDSPIFRLFLSFVPLINPKDLAKIKTETNDIEDRFRVAGKRKVNLDPGYMDYCKVVLASAKYNGQKIYLDHGIYADLTLYYEKGNFYPYPWSFPDFKSGEYNHTFLRMRELYKAQRKKIK